MRRQLMRRTLFAAVLTVILTSLVQVVEARIAPARATESHRVLITGDSITQGSSGDYTWRYRLWNKLASTAPGAVAFVGTRTDLYDNVNNQQGSQYYAASFAAKTHSALWGDSYQAELGKIGSQVSATNANVLVVMLGSNDLAYFTTPEQTIANVKTYIARARAAAPGIDVVVGEALNKWDPWAGEYQLRDQVADYASRLATMADQLNTASQRVVIAPTRNGWDSRTQTWDGTHPNPTGEALIAQRISEGLTKIGVGTAGSDISGATAWSVPGPTPGLTAGSEKAVMTWNRAPSGATSMFIEQRLTNNNEPWLRLPYAVGGDGWTAEMLAGGGTYQFRLVPAKGFSAGVAGPAASVTVTGPTPGVIGSVSLVPGSVSIENWQTAKATWSSSANATGYLLSYRQMRDIGMSWYDFPYPVSQTNWTLKPVNGGHRYQFRVRGARGFINGARTSSAVMRMPGLASDVALVALGDSYSSGLGSEAPYTNASCLRSDGAWPMMILDSWITSRGHFACAGDKIDGVRVQLTPMNHFFAAHPASPQLITLTIGGNDVGFTPILKECVMSSCDDKEGELNDRIRNLGVALTNLYADIRNMHPYADIMVGGYPGVIQQGGSSRNKACMMIDVEERDMVDRMTTKLNDTIAASASAVGVGSVGQAIKARFAGHNACAFSGAWIREAEVDFDAEGFVDKRSFHPNDGGQYWYAEVFTDSIWARVQ